MIIIEILYQKLTEIRNNEEEMEQLWNKLIVSLPKDIQLSLNQLTTNIETPFELTFATEQTNIIDESSLPYKFKLNQNISKVIRERFQSYLDNFIIIAKWK